MPWYENANKQMNFMRHAFIHIEINDKVKTQTFEYHDDLCVKNKTYMRSGMQRIPTTKSPPHTHKHNQFWQIRIFG